MTPYLTQPGIDVYHGDALRVLRELPGESVQCCVTSPPYWGLRDYGADGQIGLEPTPAEYVARLVEVFGEVRRVLKDDGVAWVNLGDSYATSPPGNKGFHYGPGRQAFGTLETGHAARDWKAIGLKQKDLVGIPWAVAFALRADGWYLRQEVVWNKPNAMPEPVEDRPTRSHEQLFLLAKSPRYFYDAAAVREPLSETTLADGRFGSERDRDYDEAAERFGADTSASRRRATGGALGNPDGRNKRSVWTIPVSSYPGSHFATWPPALVEPCILAGSRPGDVVLDPFHGSGTTGAVAQKWGRRYVGIELSAAYIDLSKERFRQGVLFPAGGAA